jgi:hypothetical protein
MEHTRSVLPYMFGGLLLMPPGGFHYDKTSPTTHAGSEQLLTFRHLKGWQKFALSHHPSFSPRILMEEGRNSSLSVNTATQPEVEQPLTRLSPWVRVVACICFFVIAATLSSTIGYFCRVDDFEMIDKNLNVTDVAGGAVSVFNLYREPYV